MPARVDPNLCKETKECLDACPTEAITVIAGHAHVNEEDCTECRACVEVCLQQAITMLEE